MPSDKINYTTLSFIISKFIFTVVIGVLFFMFNIKSIGENTLTVLYNNLHKNNISTITNNTWHNSATIEIIESELQNDTYQNLCIQTPSLCNIIHNNINNKNQQDQYNLHTIKTLQHINTILSKNYPTLDQWLHSIIIKDEPWDKRWYSNHNAIVINIDKLSYEEYDEVLIHELWHIIDLWIIEGFTELKNTLFTEFNKAVFSINDLSLLYYTLSRDSENQRKIITKKEDFCTVYWMNNPFEDFAECFNLYLNHNSYFNTIKKSSSILDKKYDFIAQLFSNHYIHTDTSSWNNENVNYRYWDSTRMKKLVK
jgi:hypothetical protein